MTYVNNFREGSFHLFLKAEHTAGIFTVIVILFAGLGIMRIRMMAVKELNDMEATFVDIEVDVPGLEVRSTGLPDFCFRIKAFNFLPGGKADALAVCFRTDEQQIQMVMLSLFIDRQHQSPDDPAIFPDTISNTVIDTALYCLTGNDLAVLLKVAVPLSEFLHSSILKSPLIVENKLLPIILCKSCQRNSCHDKKPHSIKMIGNNRISQPFVPSSPGILSNRRPAKLSLYDPLRYGVLSSDDRYLICTGIIPWLAHAVNHDCFYSEYSVFA